MSRTGRKAISIPKNVKIEINDKLLLISGKYGKFEHSLPHFLNSFIKDEKLFIVDKNTEKDSKKFYGLNRSLIANKILGVSEPFKKILISQGVGYRFQVVNKKLTLTVGFSHPVELEIPNSLEASVEANTKLTLSCIDKELLGQFASKVRAIRPPEPYKGKGIKYENEIILRKVGKAGK